MATLIFDSDTDSSSEADLDSPLPASGSDLVYSMLNAFPDVSRRVIDRVIREYRGDYGKVVDELLSLSASPVREERDRAGSSSRDGRQVPQRNYTPDTAATSSTHFLSTAGASVAASNVGAASAGTSFHASAAASAGTSFGAAASAGTSFHTTTVVSVGTSFGAAGATAAASFDPRDYMTELDVVEMRYQKFLEYFPQADPEFLREKAVELKDDERKAQEWLNNMMEKRDYPTLLEYLKRKGVSDVLRTYSDMDAQGFLSVVADPAALYSRVDRQVSKQYKACALGVLKAVFPGMPEGELTAHFEGMNGLLAPTFDMVTATGWPAGVLPGYDSFGKNEALDLGFIQEFTYLRLRDQIGEAKSVMARKRKSLARRAKADGAIFECPICFESEVLLEDTRDCSAGGGHMFCIDCVSRQAEVAAEEGRPKVSCLHDGCPGFFSLSQLSGLLTPALLARLLREVQQCELREAEVEGLEECPFCSFPVAIEDPGMAVFKCLNPVCMIDTCRKCKRPDHGSVPCDQVEDDDQVRARKLLEEKLTSALIRNCPRCKKQVVKNEGCNHMTCPCGCHFCYICRQEIVGRIASHFSGASSCRQHLDSAAIHAADLAKAAEEGKRELADRFGRVKLVHDPTKDLASG